MSNWKIELYDPLVGNTYNITDKVFSINTTKALDQGVNGFSIRAYNIYLIHKKNIITIYKENVVWLKGIVINQFDSQSNGYKLTEFECSDNAFIMGRRLVAEVYTATDSTQGKPSEIIKDIILNYLSESGFTGNSIKDSPASIINAGDALEFPYIYAQDAIERIMEHLYDWHYYIDNNRDFHFFYRSEKSGKFDVVEHKNNPSLSCIIKDSISIESIGDEEFNRVWIIGANKPSDDAIDQFYTGDGQQRYFNLSYQPNELKIYLNGIEKNVQSEDSDDGTADFLIDSSERVFYIPPYKTPFTGTIKANYKPSKQIIDKFENQGSINTFGLYERIIKDSDITSRSSARKIGLTEIKRKSVIKKIIRFSTRKVFELGASYSITIKLDGVDSSGNVYTDVWDLTGRYLVKEISSDITPSDEVYSIVMEEIV